MDRPVRKHWWKAEDREAPNIIWSHLTALTEWRRRRLRDHALLAWLYERERYDRLTGANLRSDSGTPLVHGGGDTEHRYGWPTDAQASLPLLKSRVDTVFGRICRELPAIESTPYNGTYEIGFAARRQSDVLNGTMNAPQSAEPVRRPGLDGLLAGWGGLMPGVENGELRYQRVLYRQVWWDPADAQGGEPQNLHYWVRMARSRVIGMVEGWDDIGKAERRRLISEIEGLPPADQWGPLAEPSSGTLTPYEREMQGGSTAVDTYGSDLLHLVYSWHLPGRADNSDGKYLITAHGGGGTLTGVRAGKGAVLHSGGWERRTFPVCWFSPFPAYEGIDGVGLGHTLLPFQRQLDRSWTKLDKELKTLGWTSVLVFGKDKKNAAANAQYPGITVTHLDGVDGPLEKPYEVVPKTPQSPQELDWVERCKSYADEMNGINAAAQSGGSKLGANASGVALMEEDDRQADRLQDIEGRWDAFLLRVAEETLNAFNDAAERDAGFRVRYADRFGDSVERVWKSIALDPKEFHLQLEPVGALGRRKAGRIQKLMELAQHQAISADAAMREMAGFADVRRLTEQEQAGARLVEWQIYGLSMPENDPAEYDKYWPTEETPLDLAMKDGLSAIQIAQRKGAKPETIQRLREYVALAKALADKQAAESAPAQPPMPPEMAPTGVEVPGGEVDPAALDPAMMGPPGLA